MGEVRIHFDHGICTQHPIGVAHAANVGDTKSFLGTFDQMDPRSVRHESANAIGGSIRGVVVDYQHLNLMRTVGELGADGIEKKCDIEVVVIFKPKLFAEGKNFQDRNFHAPSASKSFYECPDCGFTLEGNFSDEEGNDLTAHDCREVQS